MKNLLKVSLLAIVLVLGIGEALGQYVWTQDARNPILSGGAIGAWNGNVMVPCVLFNTDSSRYEMWFGASDGTFNIGFATSKDGINWTMYPTPVLSSTPGTWDATWVQAPMVIRENGQYKMWYTSYRNIPPVYPYSIGYATSPDGIHWTKYSGNPVLGPGTAAWEAGGPYSCAVMSFPGGYKMWYAGSDSTESRHSMGYATSVDGITWRRDTVHNPVMNYGATGQWDSPYVGLPYVLQIGNTCYMWYAGNGSGVGREIRSIGVATSNDSGITWTKYANNPLLFPSPGTWYSRDVLPGSVLRRGDTLDMWYAASDDNHVYRIGHATSLLPGVRHSVPQDYATIQGAIDASSNRDTVLVSEGTYKENIRYHGKRIIVASRYLIDNDTTHIAKTIIDGSGSTVADSGSAVYFVNGEDTNSVLCGFTITGGTGTRYYYTTSLGPNWVRVGGGIFCSAAGARITRNIITHNRMVVPSGYGAGLEAAGTNSFVPEVILEDNRFTDNYVQSTTNSTYWSFSGGADFSGVTARVIGNVFERDTVVGNVGAAGGGMSLAAYDNLSPRPTCQIIGNIFRSNIIKGYSQGAVGAGLLLQWTADVTVQDNLFESNTATSQGSGSWAQGGGLCVTDQDITVYGRKTIANNRFLNNSVGCTNSNIGGALDLFKTLATVSGNEFSGNVVSGVGGGDYGGPGGGAAICTYATSFRIENNIIAGNYSARDGGGVIISTVPQVGTEQLMINNTVVNNQTKYDGGGMIVYSAPNFVGLNNIFWNDSATVGSHPEIFCNPSTPTIAYSDLKGGYPGDHNIDADPNFVDSTYRLSDSSKCIGGGTDSTQIGSQWYRAPRSDFYGSLRPNPAGTKPDIGACENPRGDPLVGVAQDGGGLPFVFALEQNYPNPFNPSTTICYGLPNRSHVTLTVFNTLGQQVALLQNGEQEAGYHEVKFDGSGLSSGVYFYRIEAGSFVQTRKLLLIR